MKHILAHDLGTSGNKATLYDEEGRLIKSTVSSYPTTFFNGNWAEQDPADWWKAVCVSTKELLEGMEAVTIAAVSFSGHMMGCIPVDKNGRPLYRHILYCDQRGERQMKALEERVSPWEVYTITGNRPTASYSLGKFLWLKENEPSIYKKTYKFLNAKDYIAYRLTGVFATDYSDAGGTDLFDIRNMQWSEYLSDAAGIDLDKMPDAFESAHVMGSVSKEASLETGIPAGTPVVCGAGDGCAAGVGAGSISAGTCYTCIGSSAWIATTTERPFTDPEMRIPTYPHAVPGLYHSPTAMQTAGASFSWATHEVFGTAHGYSVKDPYVQMDAEIEQAGPGAHGVIFLPYLMGERAPWWDNDAKACFLGIRQETERGDLLRAVQEGVSFNLRLILDVFREYMEISEMSFVGGAARSDLWTSILCDVCGTTIVRPTNLEECSSMGAAIIGGVGVGVFESFDAVQPFFRVQSRIKPDEGVMNVYNERLAVFKKSYYALKDLFPLL